MRKNLQLLLTPQVLLVMAASALYGLVVGAIPGFSAAMAVALMVPVTYFLEPVPALAGVVTLCAMAIFSGDIPGALLRIPGTPASAAYADEAYKMTQKGRAGEALGTGLICSAIGGIFGAVVLLLVAPSLSELALLFSTPEYFWLAALGLTAAIGVSASAPAAEGREGGMASGSAKPPCFGSRAAKEVASGSYFALAQEQQRNRNFRASECPMKTSGFP